MFKVKATAKVQVFIECWKTLVFCTTDLSVKQASCVDVLLLISRLCVNKVPYMQTVTLWLKYLGMQLEVH